MPTYGGIGGSRSHWSQEQVDNAALIYKVGKRMGMTNRDIQIALITAMVESNLKNVDYGDRDSLGLFQQRPSQGWGTPQQVMDPTYAASRFYDALASLGDRRYKMSMGQAAQAVQRSAYPDRYGQMVGEARSLWPRIATVAGDRPRDMDGDPYGALDPLTGAVKPDQAPLPDQSVLDANTPDLLGEMGGLGTDQSSLEAAGLLISPATNETVLRKAMERAPGFQKGVDGWRKGVVEMARRYIGTPYVWGGTSPNGFDCSGLIQYVFQEMGIGLPRVSFQQARSGQRVALNALEPGDLVAWDNSSRNNGADHIALYVGNGQIIEAPRPGLTVRVRSLGRDEGAWGVRMTADGTQA